MTTLRTALGTLLSLSVLTSSATAQIYTEDFDAGSNVDAWEIWWDAFTTVESTGGNGGGYLRFDNHSGSLTCQFLDIYPVLPTAVPSGFTGDWRAAQIDSVGLDVNVAVGPFTGFGGWTVVIGDDNGTPADKLDDCRLEFSSTGQIPPMTQGVWESFDFPIPSDSTVVPTGWVVTGPCVGGPDAVWNSVIQDVDYFGFRMDYDPSGFCSFWHWNMGVDNLRVERSILGTSYCYGDGAGMGCPCGNLGGTGEGCQNSSGSGAVLAASGSASFMSDDLTLEVTQGPSNVSGVVFFGTAQTNGGAGILFGDGLRCAGGALQRLGVVSLDGNGAGTWGPGLASQGGWAAGDTRYFQGWFRDNAGPCGFGFNTSQAMTLTFLP